MSDYGFSARNDNGQVLVHQDMQVLHFYERLPTPYISPLHPDSNGLYETYWFFSTAPTVPVPFFTIPGRNQVVGVTRILGVPGSWQIEVVHSTLSSPGMDPPYLNRGQVEMYIFCGLADRASTETHGMVVYKADGVTRAFDSRFLPLVVVGGYNVAPPSTPFTNTINPGGGITPYDDERLSSDSYPGVNFNNPSNIRSFASKERNSYQAPWLQTAAKPIYAYSALGQAEREATFNDHDEWPHGSITTTCTHWAFYRSAISVTDGALQCGWATARRGYMGAVRRIEVAGWGGVISSAFAGALINSLLKASLDSTTKLLRTPDGSDWSGYGFWPYANNSINTRPSPVIVSDGALYD
jgi:hypothetical protein